MSSKVDICQLYRTTYLAIPLSVPNENILKLYVTYLCLIYF